ncbi:MAG: DUF5689 domain-containing protein [Rikenellaceae bacterium]
MGRSITYTILIVAVTLIMGSCYDSFEGGGELPSSDAPLPNITIAELHELVVTDRMTIYDDMVVQGVVTSSDENGNFYKTFVIERDGYALEVMEGLYDSFARHDVGSVVSVRLQGLALSRYMGVLQVGLIAEEGSYYMLDYLGSEQIVDNYIFHTYTFENIEPYIVDYNDLTEDMCGRLVSVDSLHLIPSEDALQPYTWSGYQLFVDNYGDSLYCYTSDYANFALVEIPSGEVSLSGILQWNDISGVAGGEKYIIEMRGTEDCSEL